MAGKYKATGHVSGGRLLDNYNPKQFEVLDITDRQDSFGFRKKKYTAHDSPKYNDLNARATLMVNGELKAVYARILIKKEII